MTAEAHYEKSISIITGRQIHVTPTGRDSNYGDLHNPFLTINKAAQEAQPGDVVIVHAGTYRECVTPARGGTGENARIVYRAAPNEEVVIKGSERIASWTKEGELWKVELPQEFFGAYNPYALNITGEWLSYGGEHHCGEVYLNGEALYEKLNVDDVKANAKTWFAEVHDGTTTIWANFSGANPNTELTEINVRECVFYPEILGLKYITVDGFTLRHAATNWAPPTAHQKGLIGTYWGKRWIIENCLVTDGRCVGISIGNVPGQTFPNGDLETCGHHLVRRNVIQRCGQSGVAGCRGCVVSVIEQNLVEDTNYKREFGGWETAGIKVHFAADTIIRNNCVRRVRKGGDGGAYGIWVDWSCQGTRITGNVIYDTDTWCMHIEANHGPILVDNNVFMGGNIYQQSEAVIFVHNLFYNCQPIFNGPELRTPDFFAPHTLRQLDKQSVTMRDDRWYNNLFIGKGLNLTPYPRECDDAEFQTRDLDADSLKRGQADNYDINFNVYLQGAAWNRWWDRASIVDAQDTGFSLGADKESVTIRFSVNGAPFAVKCPPITNALIGKLSMANQGIEHHDGRSLSVDGDYFGSRRNLDHIVVGPFQNLKEGSNEFTLWPLPDVTTSDLSAV